MKKKNPKNPPQATQKGAPVRLTSVTCAFGERVVLDDLSFSLRSGEVTSLLGLNGAGKTTIMRILSGLLVPGSGEVRVFGVDPTLEPAQARGLMGVLPEESLLENDLTVAEHFSLLASLTGRRRSAFQVRIQELVELFDLASHFHALCGVLSKGYKQRMGLAMALFNDPEILLLDEPSSGLDPEQQRSYRELLVEIARDKTVLLSTHLLPDVERLGGRVLVLAGGGLTYDGAHPGDEPLRRALLGASQESLERERCSHA